MQLAELFNPKTSFVQIDCRSKKRLFEFICQQLEGEYEQEHIDTLFDALIDREKLGSTGLGEGVALPHCRLSPFFTRPMGFLVQLKQTIDFDAIDDQGVDLVVFLMVPGEATQEHLDTLALLAQRLSQADIRQQMREAQTSTTLCQALTDT